MGLPSHGPSLFTRSPTSSGTTLELSCGLYVNVVRHPTEKHSSPCPHKAPERVLCCPPMSALFSPGRRLSSHASNTVRSESIPLDDIELQVRVQKGKPFWFGRYLGPRRKVAQRRSVRDGAGSYREVEGAQVLGLVRQGRRLPTIEQVLIRHLIASTSFPFFSSPTALPRRAHGSFRRFLMSTNGESVEDVW